MEKAGSFFMLRVRRQIGCTDELIASCGKKGTVVAVLDTGIAGHPDFADRIIAFEDFVNGKKGIYDDSGHGTHVIGCLAGDGRASEGRLKGIAPYSLLIVGKVLDHRGDGRIEHMARGIEWVLRNRRQYDIRILNISIGMGDAADKEKMEWLLQLVDEAWDSGLVVVCAAGNLGPEPMTISPLGARAGVITVGCHEGGYFGRKEHLCETYSGRGPSVYGMKKPDLVAPGTDIVSCNAGYIRSGRRYRNAYIAKSGTSMATPVISGGAALLLQKYPFYSNEQVKHRLLHTAKDLREPWNKQGWGMIDVGRLLR